MEMPRAAGIEQEHPDQEHGDGYYDGIANPDLRLELFRAAPKVAGNRPGACRSPVYDSTRLAPQNLRNCSHNVACVAEPSCAWAAFAESFLQIPEYSFPAGGRQQGRNCSLHPSRWAAV
jgi:hypothetical protein